MGRLPVNLELALETRFVTGFTLGARVGLARLFNDKDTSACTYGSGDSSSPARHPYVGVNAGYAP